MRFRLVRWLSLSALVAIAILASACAHDPEVTATTTDPGLHRSGEVVVDDSREYLLTHRIRDAEGRDGFEILEVKLDVVDYAGWGSSHPELELSAEGGDGSPRVAPTDIETGSSWAAGEGAPPFWETNRWNARETAPKSWATAEAAFTIRDGETGLRVTAQSTDGRSEVWLIR